MQHTASLRQITLAILNWGRGVRGRGGGDSILQIRHVVANKSVFVYLNK